MQFVIFILIYPLIWFISILPFRVLYFISDLFYYLLYYIIGYRKKIVVGNLRLVFPEKSDVEIKKITKTFYKHFVDIFIEMIKSFTISEKQISKRYSFTNIEVLHALEEKGKSGILYGAHYANWEWIFNLNLKIKFNGYAIYKKVKNPYFDKKVRETRGKYNTTLVPTKETFALMAKNKAQDVLSLYGFLGDQSPKKGKIHYWADFLGVKEVPIHTGVELLAKKHDLAVVYFNTRKIKRGYYVSTFQLLTENPNEFKDYELTDLYLREVEKQIKNAPEYYFWTHKRFKNVGKGT